jgi:hypothetical protein
MTPDISRPRNYVSDVQDGEVRIENATPEVASDLRAIGGMEKPLGDRMVWVIRTPDDDALGRTLGRLRDIGFLFVDQPGGWPPAAVFDELRERGLVSGSFDSVSWINPARWRVRAR